MVAALTVMSLMWWGYWWMLRDIRPPRVPTTLATPQQPTARTTTGVGLEDDPDQCHATGGAWSVLDDRQLIRLLTDSAPTDRPATNSTGDTVTRGEQEDTA